MSIEREFRVRKNSKKKLDGFMIIGFGIVLILCIVLMAVFGAFGKKDKNLVSSLLVSSEIETSSVIETSSQSETSSNSETSSKTNTSSEAKTSSASKVSSTSSKDTSDTVSAYLPNGDWRLIIANKQHPLPESYKVNVSYVSGSYRLDSRAVDAYNSMISAAKKDGVSLVIISGFRTYQGQTTLFNNKVNKYLNQGYSREKAKELAAQYVAPPGTSEHLTGLAVDLISPDWYSYNSDLNSNFENTKQFKWLYENCAEYGFVLRYPKDKVDITGYSYEPWHYRYVGEKAAKEIMSKKICLEEYVADM